MVKLILLSILCTLCVIGIIVYSVRYCQAIGSGARSSHLSGVISALMCTTITLSVLLDKLGVAYPIFIALGGCVILAILFYLILYKKYQPADDDID